MNNAKFNRFTTFTMEKVSTDKNTGGDSLPENIDPNTILPT